MQIELRAEGERARLAQGGPQLVVRRAAGGERPGDGEVEVGEPPGPRLAAAGVGHARPRRRRGRSRGRSRALPQRLIPIRSRRRRPAERGRVIAYDVARACAPPPARASAGPASSPPTAPPVRTAAPAPGGAPPRSRGASSRTGRPRAAAEPYSIVIALRRSWRCAGSSGRSNATRTPARPPPRSGPAARVLVRVNDLVQPALPLGARAPIRLAAVHRHHEVAGGRDARRPSACRGSRSGGSARRTRPASW